MIYTSRYFWDCECINAFTYIHPKNEAKCRKCGALRDEMPDSMLNEVLHKFSGEIAPSMISKGMIGKLHDGTMVEFADNNRVYKRKVNPWWGPGAESGEVYVWDIALVWLSDYRNLATGLDDRATVKVNPRTLEKKRR